MYRQFTLESLKDFSDGKVAAAFDRLVRQAVADCMDRPGEKSERTIDIKIGFVPVIGQEGMSESVNVDVKIGGKVPKYQSAPTNCSAKTNGQLFFNEMAPDEPRQTTVDEVIGEGSQE